MFISIPSCVLAVKSLLFFRAICGAAEKDADNGSADRLKGRHAMTKRMIHVIVFLFIVEIIRFLRVCASIMKAKYLIGFILILISLSSFTACKEEAAKKFSVELPPTSVLSARSRWAIVSSSHLRLREGPSVSSSPVTTLWQNNVLEIISRDETQQLVEGSSGYWYQVAYDGLQGWVFGAYLEMYESEAEARRTARSRRE